MKKGNASLSSTAKSISRYSILVRTLSVLCVSLVALAAIAYGASYIYDQFASFSVNVNKYDMVRQGLTLNETPDFQTPISRLNAKAVQDITNISENQISADVDTINGSHNGANYVAYTFYLKNSGEDTLSYDYNMNMISVTNGIDAAVRIRIYRNGEQTTYAKTKTDGTGPERNTKEFATNVSAVKERVTEFVPGAVDKYTVVIWLEGDDVDCVDTIIGGKLKLEMTMTIVEGS